MRINVYDFGDDPYALDGPKLAGWFDSAKAERWSDGDCNGNGSGGNGRGQAVLRTAQGRWVLENWSRWQGEDSAYQFITDEEASDWLLRNDENDAVTRYFGEIEDERGPGRPEIGSPVQVRLGELLTQVDQWAAEHGATRADAIRRLVAAALAE